MTREIFNTTYPFLKDMDVKDLKQLLIFIMMSILEMSIGVKKEDCKIENFFKDLSAIAKE